MKTRKPEMQNEGNKQSGKENTMSAKHTKLTVIKDLRCRNRRQSISPSVQN